MSYELRAASNEPISPGEASPRAPTLPHRTREGWGNLPMRDEMDKAALSWAACVGEKIQALVNDSDLAEGSGQVVAGTGGEEQGVGVAVV